MRSEPSARTPRRVAGTSLAPLGTIAVSFFLPTLENCNRAHTPAIDFVETSGGISVLCTAHLAAIALFVLTLVALLRGGGPTLRMRRGAFVAGCFAALGPPVLAVILLDNAQKSARLFASGALVLGLATVFTVALTRLWDAWKSEGWRSWAHVLAAFGACAVISPLTFILGSEGYAQWSTGTPRPVLIGGWIYLAAVGAMVPVSLWAAHAARSRVPFVETPVFEGPFR